MQRVGKKFFTGGLKTTGYLMILSYLILRYFAPESPMILYLSPLMVLAVLLITISGLILHYTATTVPFLDLCWVCFLVVALVLISVATFCVKCNIPII